MPLSDWPLNKSMGHFFWANDCWGRTQSTGGDSTLRQVLRVVKETSLTKGWGGSQ